MSKQKQYVILNSEIGEDTHNKKRNFTLSARGAAPIEKNIRVVDETGKEYEATYPRRAKGLIKKGRARFTDENTICLARPTDYSEDNMAKITANEAWNRIIDTQNQLENLFNITSNIRYIQTSASYVELNSDESEYAGAPLDFSSEAALLQVQAIKELVCTREQTLQQLIAFYIGEYERCLKEEKNTEK